MNKFSMILTALLTVSLVLLIAPSIFAMNRGKTLRNVALWLAIVLGLALLYQTLGPGKDRPIPEPASQDSASDHGSDSSSDDLPADEDGQGYTPPKE